MARQMGTPRTLLAGLHLPECPRWRGERLHFSDMYGQQAFAMSETGVVEASWPVPGRPGGIGFAPNGDLLVNEMERARILRFDANGGMRVHADLGALAPSINDMISTPDGRCFVGRLTMAPPFEPAPLIAVDPEGRACLATSEAIAVANGMVWRDDRTLIVAESMAGRLLAYDDNGEGGLANRRVFAQLPAGLGPDGICGDDAGGIWVASPNAGVVYRVVEGGEITHRIDLEPGRFAYACAIGGRDRRTLFLCTGGPYEPEIATAETAGRIEAIVAPFPATTSFP
ncbi:SMP-30/gluconolactonase/LRE family protein [Novosphingobium bradum]|uniref:SMP-30/gluconolactonase/LRE family protein n=1 Tax=Novosphingobium bradum TaxID=1737444 RepID=A0ABV7IQ14_9SPHN